MALIPMIVCRATRSGAQRWRVRCPGGSARASIVKAPAPAICGNRPERKVSMAGTKKMVMVTANRPPNEKAV